MHEEILNGNHRIVRQHLSNRIVHWLVALSTFALIFTGFGQMPMYKRYGVSSLPFLGWSENFHLTLSIHYAAGAVLLFAGVFHVVYMLIRREFDILPRRGDLKESILVIRSMLGLCKAPACHKYLGEQRLAYAFIAGSLSLAIVTGLVKIYKNMPGVDVSQGMLVAATNLHNLGAMLVLFGIFGHLAAFAFKENRALLSAMFSGCVDLRYVRERHGHWYDELTEKPHRLQESLCMLKRRFAKKQEIAS